MAPGFYHGKRVLVTGHTGFKGAWLALWLERLGAHLMGFALPPATHPNLHDAIDLGARIRSVFGDVRDAISLGHAFASHRPEIVFHLAAQALVGASYADPLETFSTNVVGTASVLDACRATDSVRSIVVVSSDKCYENVGLSRGYVEADAMGGHDPYSASKGCVELLVASYRRSFFAGSGRGLASARAGNVIAGGDWTVGRLVPDCLAAIAASRPVVLRHPDSIRPWQHVLEPLSGYLQLARRLHDAPEAWAEAWNFGPDPTDACAARELVELCYRAWGVAPAWRPATEATPHEAAVLRLDSTKARTRLAWRPAWRLEEGVAATVEWHRTWLAKGGVTELMDRQIAAHGGPDA